LNSHRVKNDADIGELYAM